MDDFRSLVPPVFPLGPVLPSLDIECCVSNAISVTQFNDVSFVSARLLEACSRFAGKSTPNPKSRRGGSDTDHFAVPNSHC